MNEKNYGYLKDTLKYLGFGEGLHGQLGEKIKEGLKDFVLGHTAEFGDKRIETSLSFRRSDSSDMYFLNKWTGSVGDYEATRSQSFFINKGHGITLKEGFNLLEGRAVHKELTDREGQTYKAWLQLDREEKDPAGNYKVHQYHENYGYDLEKKLGELPIKQLTDPELREGLIRSLQKGNLQAVSFEKNGQTDQLFIAANPRFKAIDAYDQAGKQIPSHSLEKRYALANGGSDVQLIGQAALKQNVGQQQKRKSNSQEEKSTPTKPDQKTGSIQNVRPKGLTKKRTANKGGLHL